MAFKRIFSKDKQMYRIASGYMDTLFYAKDRKIKKTELAVLFYAGREFNRGRLKAKVTIRKVSKDRRVSTRTVDRAVRNLRQSGFLAVVEQGFCFRLKNRNVAKGTATVYKLTQKGLAFINGISSGFFSGIKKAASIGKKKVVASMDYLMQMMRIRYKGLPDEEIRALIKEESPG